MSNHHDDHHSNEQKPVSFTVPFILASVTLIIIFSLVSLGDPCHHGCVCAKDCSKECMEACEKGDHSKHPAKEGHGEEVKAAEKEAAVETQEAVTPVDTTEAKKEKAAEGHH